MHDYFRILLVFARENKEKMSKDLLAKCSNKCMTRKTPVKIPSAHAAFECDIKYIFY